MALTQLWLTRHGESVGNVAASRANAEGASVIELDIRDADVPLSPAGEEQAAALGEWLDTHRHQIGAFWCSPYLRARQTLEIAMGEASAPVLVDERLRDRELGILDLLTSKGVQERHPEEMARRRHLGKFYHRPPGGESWADVVLRLRSFFASVDAVSANSALLVAHDAVVMLALYVLLGLDEKQLLEFAGQNTVTNASITHLVREPAGWRLVEFSTVQHLQQEGAAVTAHSGDEHVAPR
ncbi:histidine phosphatase family protein [Rathayibacter sp. YIM 133350]|uniref:histidine phosphatase family protein n=1 Tax=Rathayibacter sp. YIM 133350 TaxID=3131992 RepID=UPI00307E2CF2